MRKLLLTVFDSEDDWNQLSNDLTKIRTLKVQTDTGKVTLHNLMLGYSRQKKSATPTQRKHLLDARAGVIDFDTTSSIYALTEMLDVAGIRHNLPTSMSEQFPPRRSFK